MSVCPDKSNACSFGDKEIAISGYVSFPTFCSFSTYIPVLPAMGECNNTYPRSWLSMLPFDGSSDRIRSSPGSIISGGSREGASRSAVCPARPLAESEIVVCVDEKTNLQPRSRLAATLPSLPGRPVRLEHEYKRVGALHLFAAFDTRTGRVYARTETRQRQVEFIAFLSQLEQELPVTKTRVYVTVQT